MLFWHHKLWSTLTQPGCLSRPIQFCSAENKSMGRAEHSKHISFFSLLWLIWNNTKWDTQKKSIFCLGNIFFLQTNLGPFARGALFQNFELSYSVFRPTKIFPNTSWDTFPAVRYSLLRFDPHQTVCKPLQKDIWKCLWTAAQEDLKYADLKMRWIIE